MALINCNECNREISSLATTCPHCGAPNKSIPQDGEVRIKIPNIYLGLVGIFFRNKVQILDDNNTILWAGKRGQTAIFNISQPTKITIKVGALTNDIVGVVHAHKKYQCVQDLSLHWKGVYTLSEVDHIDTDGSMF